MKFIKFAGHRPNLHWVTDVYFEILIGKPTTYCIYLVKFNPNLKDTDTLYEEFDSEDEMFYRLEELDKVLLYKPRPFIHRKDNFGNKSFERY